MKTLISIHILAVMILLMGCGGDENSKTYTAVVEGTAIQVPALTGGQIVDFRVDTGQEVRKGDILAITDTSELVFQRQQLRASLDELAVQHDIAHTQLNQARTNEQYLQEKRRRIAALYESNSASLQTLDDLTNQLRMAQSGRETAEQQAKTLQARKKQLLSQLQLIDKKIDDATVRAPAGGIIAEKYFELGEAVSPMNPVAEIIDLSRVKAKIYIAETTLPDIRHGQSVRVGVDGREDQLFGRVSWISPKAEFTPKTILTPETRTSLVYAVEVAVDNPEGILKHGMPVEVVLE